MTFACSLFFFSFDLVSQDTSGGVSRCLSRRRLKIFKNFEKNFLLLEKFFHKKGETAFTKRVGLGEALQKIIRKVVRKLFRISFDAYPLPLSIDENRSFLCRFLMRLLNKITHLSFFKWAIIHSDIIRQDPAEPVRPGDSNSFYLFLVYFGP